MWQCEKVVWKSDGNRTRIEYAIVNDLLEKKSYHIHAKVFVLAAGAILTPQILFNSEIQPAALGHYLCEQPMAFCQIVLKQTIVDAIEKDPRWKQRVEEHKRKFPIDPIPIPIDDPTPQVYNILYHGQF